MLEVNGSPTDAAAGLIKKGIHSAVDTSGFKLLAEYDTPDWEPAKAQDWVSGQISQFGGQIAGVVAANDGTGGGAIAAFKARRGRGTAGDRQRRRAGGGPADHRGRPVQHHLQADQDRRGGRGRGRVPVRCRARSPRRRPTLFDTPSQLFTPTVVTQENIGKVHLGPGGALKVADVCTATYAAACTKLGIK